MVSGKVCPNRISCFGYPMREVEDSAIWAAMNVGLFWLVRLKECRVQSIGWGLLPVVASKIVSYELNVVACPFPQSGPFETSWAAVGGRVEKFHEIQVGHQVSGRQLEHPAPAQRFVGERGSRKEKKGSKIG